MSHRLETVRETAALMAGRWSLPASTLMIDFGGGLSANVLSGVPGEVSAPPSEAHILSLNLSADKDHHQWRDDRLLIKGMYPTKTLGVVPSGMAPRAVLGSPMQVFHLYIPSAVLGRVASESGVASDAAAPQIVDRPSLPDPALVALIEQALVAVSASEPVDRLWRHGLAHAICGRLLQRWSTLSPSPPRGRSPSGLAPWQLRRVCDRMAGDLANVPDLAELAAMVNLSVEHFCRAFGRSTGAPPHRWLLRRRMDRARELLLDPKTSVADVAAGVGYRDPGYFARAFRRDAGMTPQAYRRQLSCG